MNKVTVQEFHQELETHSGMKLQLKINDNVSTYLSVRRENREAARVSVHRIFLEAPHKVLLALASYIKGGRNPKRHLINGYIEENQAKLDYSHRVERSKLITQGRVYDLQKLYDEVNEEYFNGELDLSITWYGRLRSQKRRQVTFGLYYDTLKLVKIHRILDDASYPEYFVSYVIYHEMLHHVCPVQVSEEGRCTIHGKDFNALERQFKHYDEVQVWMKENKSQIFGLEPGVQASRKENSYGWA